MKVLLVYPRFPQTFWSYEKVLSLVGRKALMPPLGLVTVGALLPRDWQLRLVDRNVRPVPEDVPELEEFLWGYSFWADGYFAESVGKVDEEVIRKYIKTQK